MKAEILVRALKSDKFDRSSSPETSVTRIDWAIEIYSDRVADRKLGNSQKEQETSMPMNTFFT